MQAGRCGGGRASADRFAKNKGQVNSFEPAVAGGEGDEPKSDEAWGDEAKGDEKEWKNHFTVKRELHRAAKDAVKNGRNYESGAMPRRAQLNAECVTRASHSHCERPCARQQMARGPSVGRRHGSAPRLALVSFHWRCRVCALVSSHSIALTGSCASPLLPSLRPPPFISRPALLARYFPAPFAFLVSFHSQPTPHRLAPACFSSSPPLPSPVFTSRLYLPSSSSLRSSVPLAPPPNSRASNARLTMTTTASATAAATTTPNHNPVHTRTSTPTTGQITLATTDPLAATDSFNLFEDSFAHFLRTSRNSRPLSSTAAAAPAPTGLSPRVYGLSPRLPSALPPSASPRIVEPVTPDRQPVRPIPYCSTDDTVDLPTAADRERELAIEKERHRRLDWANALPTFAGPAPGTVDVVDEKETGLLFDSLPRKPLAAPLMNMSAPEPRQADDKRADGFPPSLALPLELPPLRNPAAHTAPLPWDSDRIYLRASPSPLAQWGKDPAALLPERPDLQLPSPPLPSTFSDRFQSAFRRPSMYSPPPPAVAPLQSADNLPCVSGPTSSISDADSAVTRERRRRRPQLDNDADPDAETDGDAHMADESFSRLPSRPSRRTPPRPMAIARHCDGVVEDPLQCHICGQRFARRSNLFKHLRSVHEEMRRFACKQCSFKFKRQDHLIKHTRSVHAKVRKFSCEICGMGFAEKFNRDKHRRSIHETKRPFQCPCSAYFQDQDKMQNCLRCKQREAQMR